MRLTGKSCSLYRPVSIQRAPGLDLEDEANAVGFASCLIMFSVWLRSIYATVVIKLPIGGQSYITNADEQAIACGWASPPFRRRADRGYARSHQRYSYTPVDPGGQRSYTFRSTDCLGKDYYSGELIFTRCSVLPSAYSALPGLVTTCPRAHGYGLLR